MHYMLEVKTTLAHFILAISTPIGKLPNLIPCQTFWLYGIRVTCMKVWNYHYLTFLGRNLYTGQKPDISGLEPMLLDISELEPMLLDISGLEPMLLDISGQKPMLLDISGQEPRAFLSRNLCYSGQEPMLLGWNLCYWIFLGWNLCYRMFLGRNLCYWTFLGIGTCYRTCIHYKCRHLGHF